MEVWKDVPGYEGLYQVSNLGRVKSLERWRKNGSGKQKIPERIMSQNAINRGYLMVQLSKNGVYKNVLVHRIVAEAFVQNLNGLDTVNHINGNKTDNRSTNLEWVTRGDNLRHAFGTGLNGADHRKLIRVAQYDKDMNLIKIYPSMNEAARQTGVNEGNINRGVYNGWKFGGFIWKLVD